MKSSILCLHENDLMNMIQFLAKSDKRNLILTNKEIATKLLQWIPHDRETLNRKLYQHLQAKFMETFISECYVSFLSTKDGVYDEDDFNYIDVIFDFRSKYYALPELTFVYEQNELWAGIYEVSFDENGKNISQFKYHKVQSFNNGDKVIVCYDDLLDVTNYVMNFLSPQKKILIKTCGFSLRSVVNLHPAPLFQESIAKISKAYSDFEEAYECESIKDRIFFNL